jgi:hypothetical protein
MKERPVKFDNGAWTILIGVALFATVRFVRGPGDVEWWILGGAAIRYVLFAIEKTIDSKIETALRAVDRSIDDEIAKLRSEMEAVIRERDRRR